MMRLVALTALTSLVLVASSALAETIHDACPAPDDPTVTVVCIFDYHLTVHAVDAAHATAALVLVGKNPQPRPSN